MNNKRYLHNEKLIRQFGKNLKLIRKTKELSQKVVSDRARITPTYISKMESGKVNPSLSHLGALADALRVPLHELLRFSEQLDLPIYEGRPENISA